MDSRLSEELAALRTRAYGPDADIDGDPDAVQRLRELEDRALEPEIGDAPVAPTATVDAVDPSDGPVSPASGESQPPRADSLTPRTWGTRRMLVVWIASLAVTVIATATVTAFISHRVQADPREVAVLAADPSGEWPGIYGERPEGGEMFAVFHGLRPIAAMGTPMAYTASDCLSVAEESKLSPDQSSYEGRLYTGCEAGGFPATAELIVNAETPAELRAQYPEGTALQFVLEGSRVIVLSDPPR
jgi:hypothetical protein